MNYKLEKKKLLEKQKEILAQYYRLFFASLKVSSEMGDFLKSLDQEQVMDWEMTVSESADNIKFVRLMSALLYIEYPKSVEVVQSLLNDIELNGPDSKLNR